ncbi:zinc ribbon domain-containing protein [Acinetobacter radioresistens]|uniref:zinc ribbon domain-containing protein n=1 Tax=Acinetobacter radioresistens TaxID=40216 RepID=UPI0032B39419
MEFSKQQLIGLAGGLLLLLGVFLPIASMPIVGSVSIFSSGRIDGYILLGLAIISLILAFVNALKLLRITGGISILIVVIDFIYLLYKLNSIKGEVADKLKGNPFGGMAEAMISTVQIQYGWVFLFIGSFMVIYSAVAKPLVQNIGDNDLDIKRNLATPSFSKPSRPRTKLVADDLFTHNAGKPLSTNVDEFKNCPFCDEQIKIAAIKCKHCGSMMNQE